MTENKIGPIENHFRPIKNEIRPTENNFRPIENKIGAIENNFRPSENKLGFPKAKTEPTKIGFVPIKTCFGPIDKIPKIGPDLNKISPQISKIFQIKIGCNFIRINTVVTKFPFDALTQQWNYFRDKIPYSPFFWLALRWPANCSRWSQV